MTRAGEYFLRILALYLAPQQSRCPPPWIPSSQDILYLQESAAGADHFRSTFEVGLTNYINGLWVQAAECFRACDAMMEQVGGDGPSRTLLRYMQERDFKCPADWQGFRPLTSK